MKLKKMIAVGCAVIALAAAAALYGSEYAYTAEQDSLAGAITAFTLTHSRDSGVVDLSDFSQRPGACVEVLGVTGDRKTLSASFADPDEAGLRGTAVFRRGLNRRYRLVSADYEDRGGIGKAELFLPGAGCLLLLWLGAVLARYFWTGGSSPESRPTTAGTGPGRRPPQ